MAGGFFLSEKTAVLGLRLYALIAVSAAALVVAAAAAAVLIRLLRCSDRRWRRRPSLRVNHVSGLSTSSSSSSEVEATGFGKEENANEEVVVEMEMGWGGRWYAFAELEAATGGFGGGGSGGQGNVIGKGGCGTVYRGVLPDCSVVAVKNLHNNKGQAEEEFKVEVEALGKVRHKNLVGLIGYCAEGSKRIAYLHEGIEPKVVHRDIKSSNILLDKQWNPKVSDFGFAKLLGAGSSFVTTRVMGTFGYVAPEYVNTGLLNEGSDAYSFGVLLMELMSGRNPVDYSRPVGEINLVEWFKGMVGKRCLEEVLDPSIKARPSSRELKRVVLVCLRCVDPDTQKRPRMGHVVHMLEGDEFPFRTVWEDIPDEPAGEGDGGVGGRRVQPVGAAGRGAGLFAGSCPTSIAEIMGRQSMLALVGDAHREMRSIAVAFLGGGTSGGLRRRSRFFATVERQAAKVLNSWNDRVCHGSVGAAASFSAHKEAKNFTFSVMVKHLISMEEETAEAKQLSKEYATFMRGMASLPLNLPGMAHRKARKSRAKILSLIGQKLDERIKQKLQENKLLKEAEKAAEEEEEGGGDLLDLVLKHQNLTREQILDLVLSMLFAGHETSSAAIALAIYFLQSSPKAVQQLRTLPVKSGNSLMSFGCGPRLCPGAEFGKLEMAVFLHHLVQRFHWELAEHDFPVSFPFLGFPKGLPIKIRPIGP
uniref:non-specific serine/threonine protein kinase n=1 Tax=Ananas comosus var. bracteatus TaxID=296719 RepID=A0A6V7NI36_ANACO|nr:unnamed protein product [Ananas comosus var. bracteatus]